MAASYQDIQGWFESGRRAGSGYMLIVCDTFDYDDYPVFADDKAEAVAEYKQRHGVNMQRVMEVYDLRGDMKEQLSMKRCNVIKGDVT